MFRQKQIQRDLGGQEIVTHKPFFPEMGKTKPFINRPAPSCISTCQHLNWRLMVDRLLLQVIIAFPTEKPSPEQRRYELWIQAGAPMEITCREIEISHKQATLVCPLKAAKLAAFSALCMEIRPKCFATLLLRPKRTAFIIDSILQ